MVKLADRLQRTQFASRAGAGAARQELDGDPVLARRARFPDLAEPAAADEPDERVAREGLCTDLQPAGIAHDVNVPGARGEGEAPMRLPCLVAPRDGKGFFATEA